MLVRGQLRKNAQNTREILNDLFTSNALSTVTDQAARRKSRLQLLPYGIPLCLGFVGYLVFLYGV
jgi:prepilin peptidase CpaA